MPPSRCPIYYLLTWCAHFSSGGQKNAGAGKRRRPPGKKKSCTKTSTTISSEGVFFLFLLLLLWAGGVILCVDVKHRKSNLHWEALDYVCWLWGEHPCKMKQGCFRIMGSRKANVFFFFYFFLFCSLLVGVRTVNRLLLFHLLKTKWITPDSTETLWILLRWWQPGHDAGTFCWRILTLFFISVFCNASCLGLSKSWYFRIPPHF